MRKNDFSVSKCFGVLAAAAALSVSGSADAAATGYTTPYSVSWSDGRLEVVLQGSDTIYYAWTSGTSSPCSNQTMDSLKTWQSLAHSALLAGKRIKITYSVCGGRNYINIMSFAT